MKKTIDSLEHVLASKDFAYPVLFPFKTTREDLRILHARGVDDLPGTGAESYDYILAIGLKSDSVDFHRLLETLLPLLKPGGVIAAHTYGYSGYYGLNMLGSIIRKFTPDTEDFTIAQAVISQLPSNHPANKRERFMDMIRKGDKKTLKELIHLSADKIYTVSRLLNCIEQSGGRLLDWVFPGFYDPGRYIENRDILEKLSSLREPYRWEIAELINAQPSEHYFFVGKKETLPIAIPWDPGDLFSWRPVRLPLYRWEDLPGTGIDDCAIHPVVDVEEIEPVKLEDWQTRFCRSANGSDNLDRLLAGIKAPHPDVIEFLKRSTANRLIALLPPV